MSMILSSKTPLPYRQLFIIILVRMSEPISFTFLFPFLYFMVRDFNLTTDSSQVGYYVGLLGASFPIAQIFTGLIWGLVSDRIGRKPVMLISLFGVGTSLVSFGLSKTFHQAIISRLICGATTGSISAIKSMVGEMTDSTNRAEAFSYLTMSYIIGSIIGPCLGGFLSNPAQKYSWLNNKLFRDYPYLLPCLVCALLCYCSFVAGYLLIEETVNLKIIVLESSNSCLEPNSETQQLLQSSQTTKLSIYSSIRSKLGVFSTTKDTFLAIIGAAGLTFQTTLHDELFPLWAATTISGGGLSFDTSDIGTILSVTGFFSFIVQYMFNAKMQNVFGPLKTYQIVSYFSVFLFIVYPFTQKLKNTTLLWVCLVLMNVCRASATVFGLTSVSLIMTQTARQGRLGLINGIDQTTRSLARASAPIICGALWSWSLGSGRPYPFDSYLAWNFIVVVCLFNSMLAYFINRSSANTY